MFTKGNALRHGDPGHQQAWLSLPWSCLDQKDILWSADAAAFFFRQIRRCCHRHTGNARLVGQRGNMSDLSQTFTHLMLDCVVVESLSHVRLFLQPTDHSLPGLWQKADFWFAWIQTQQPLAGTQCEEVCDIASQAC